MKCRFRISLLAVLFASLPSAVQAMTTQFTLNTTAFMNVPAGNQPMYLYFQLASGGVQVDNTVTINGFSLGASGSFGLGAGNQGGINATPNTLAANGAGFVNLKDDFAGANNFAVYFQQWTPGEQLNFTVTVSPPKTDYDAGNTEALDSFLFGILYADPGNGFDLSAIDPTLPGGSDYVFFNTSGAGGIELLYFDISNTMNSDTFGQPNTNGSIFAYAPLPEGSQQVNNIFGGATPAAPFVIPEPSTYVIWGVTLLFGGGYLYRRRKIQQQGLLLESAQA